MSSKCKLNGRTFALPANVLRRSRHFLAGLCRRADSVILKKCVVAPSATDGFAITRYDSYKPAVVHDHRAVGNAHTEARIRSRFRNGLIFCALREEGVLVASMWLVHGASRFIDEIGYHFAVGEDELWLRDGFVASEARGRGLYASFLEHLLCEHFPNVRTVWGDVSRSNQSSLRAQARAGFHVVDRFSCLHLAKLLMIRHRAPQQIMPVSGFRYTRRVLLTGRAFQHYRSEHLA